MIGKIISHYKISEELGRGGMGVVYKAHDIKLDRDIALKFLPPELTRDPEAKQRFIHEAQAASALDHNNICVVHEIGETEEGQIFICMNFYEGETLNQKIAEGPLKLNEAIDITIQIAQGLTKAHEQNIIHRDIKPANIIITDDGVAKIVDFGLAKLSSRTKLTNKGTTLGTVAYMSPEQTRGQEVDHRTDIWSLGTILYEMITGTSPFKGDYDQAVMYAIVNEEPDSLTSLRSGIPLELEPIVKKMLQKDRNDRYQHIDEVGVDLKLLKQDSQIGIGFSRPVKRFSISKRWTLTFIIMFIVIALGVWLFNKDKESGLYYERSKSIGVLLFVPLNKTSDDSIFADGIHDDILTQLSKISDLRVIARTSMILYKDTKKRISEIGNELDVGYLLEGSIRRSGSKLRISAQLINTETEGHVWADVYDRNQTDIFAIQSEIAGRIAEELNLRLSPAEKRSIETPMTSSIQAHEYYLKGQYYWVNYFDSSGNAKAAEMFDSAAYYDPKFVDAFAKASMAHTVMYVPGLNWDHSPERLERVKMSLAKAMALAPNSPKVRLAKGFYYQNVENDKYKALQEYEPMLKEFPGLSVEFSYIALLYAELGDLPKAKEILHRMRILDPVSVTSVGESFQFSAQLREWSIVKKEAEEYLARHPDDPSAYLYLTNMFIDGFGDLKEARKILNEGIQQPPLIFLGGRKIKIFDFWRVEYFERHYDAAMNCLATEPPTPSSRYLVQKYINSGITLLAEEDVKNAIFAFDSALVILEKLIKKQGDYSLYYYASFGIALAGIGKGNEAIQYLKAKIETISSGSQINLYIKPDLEEALVKVYVLSGKYQEAVELMEDILSKPGTITLWKLRLDPLYDPLRKDPRFKKLVADE